MLKLRRLRVERFRSLERGAELSFSDGINVLLGQNGTGKTTLLELISMVVRSDFSTLAKEEFAIEYELSVPDGECIIVVVRNERVSIEQPERPVELGQQETFRPSTEVFSGTDRHLAIRYDARNGLSVRGAWTAASGEHFSPVERDFLFSLVLEDPTLSSLFFPHLVHARKTYRLDESLDTFRRITTEEVDRDIWMFQGQWTTSGPLLVPTSIVQRLQVSHEPGKPDYSLTDSDLPLLATLKSLMGFTASGLRVDVTEKPHGTSLQIGNLVFRFWWEDGTLVTHERLSYGQKRLVTFFYYLACNPDIVIADELVNGLHHRWITASIEAIGQRQAFLTSQNPLLLDYVPVTSAEEARRSFVLCRGEPRAGMPGWIWENMSEEDANELFSAYGVGVEHVSEILQSRGLW